ncbi:MAG: Mov34/MPN/PAD-1 family protein [Acidimicrobiales bacterium]
MSDSSPASSEPVSKSASAPGSPATSGLHLTRSHLDEMIAHCLGAYPEEGCGLLTGDVATGTVAAVHPTANLEASARAYTVDPREHLLIDRAAEADGRAVIGVFHSHTRTHAYPSPTDVAQAPDPSWHYVVVSLRDEAALVRSFRIVDGLVTEEAIEALGG